MKRTYQRGEMYYADLGRGVGSEQEGQKNRDDESQGTFGKKSLRE